MDLGNKNPCHINRNIAMLNHLYHKHLEALIVEKVAKYGH